MHNIIYYKYMYYNIILYMYMYNAIYIIHNIIYNYNYIIIIYTETEYTEKLDLTVNVTYTKQFAVL